MGRRIVCSLACALAVACPGMARPDEPHVAPVVLPGESASAARSLEAARALARAQKWGDAVAAYQQLIDAPADEMVPLRASHCVGLRWLCHLDLARLGPEALALYRARVEAQARKWLDRGTATRDERLLRRVVDETFCSLAGAEALDLLGDLAFERGDYGAAEAWWRLLARPAGERDFAGSGSLALVYPADPRVDLALVRAKQILARIVQGKRHGLEAAIDAFAHVHGGALGRLAGRQGCYGAILRDLGRQPDPFFHDRWPTLAGSYSRDGAGPRDPQIPKAVRRLCLAGPRWQIRLDGQAPAGGHGLHKPGQVVPESTAARTLACYPVIAGDQVLVADARSVTAFDWRTGARETWYDLAADHRAVPPGSTLPARPDARNTLTVAEGHVLARLGAPELGDLPEENQARESCIVCLRLRAGRDGQRLRWVVKPASSDRALNLFEGTPVCQAGRVYVAATRFSGNQNVTTIYCYPLHTDDTEPAPLWRQDVCSAREDKGMEPRFQHHLLTVAGPLIVYVTHSGAVIALDAATGRHAWAVRYPSRQLERARLHDLAPCVYADGRIFVAPADADRLLCLDAATGLLLWERDRIEVVHLLGVGHGRLIFTTPEGIRAVGAASGSDGDGWYQPGGGGRWLPYGRGLLLGDLVFWPTARFGLRVLRQEDGQPPPDLDLVPLQRVHCGNLAYADGCLAVAGREALSLYTAPRQAAGQVSQFLILFSLSWLGRSGTMGDCVGADGTNFESHHE